MKIVLFILNALLLIPNKPVADIVVKVSNLSDNNGQVIVLLYNSETNFLKQAVLKKTAKISNNKSAVIFNEIPEGVYAIAVIHDENNNGKLDFNFFGIPSENVAASNNAKAFIGPPSFEDAKFYVNNILITQNIKM